ncbi:unnamed protein product [Clonostachys rosea f. rosea IK726]|uniref:Xylanolytic transcriptional activator regulatory domain-containing protein n=2 Tax=Bionectria ochroleuca TaxID=29856 RepID=A0A0B7K195_BIOOC|nr:unnamed protein product [Clonostachys rosea f. rosea IK726]
MPEQDSSKDADPREIDANPLASQIYQPVTEIISAFGDPDLAPFWDQMESLGEVNPNDLSHHLHQYNVGDSSNFLEASTLNDTLDGQYDLGRDFVSAPQTTDGPSMRHPTKNSISDSSLPRIRDRGTPNGKVSSIDLLTRKDLRLARLQQSTLPGVFVSKNEAATSYIGFSSVGATLGLCIKDALESQQLPLESSSLGFLIEASAHISHGIRSSSLPDFLLQDLPPHQLALKYSKAYLRNINAFYPVVDEASYPEQTERFYTTERSSLGILDHCIFFLIVSIGATSLGERPDHTDEIKAVYQRASSLFHDCIVDPSESSLQVVLLHTLYQLCNGHCGVAWTFCGLAIRTAQSMGLHRKSPMEMELPDHQLRLRSWLWWITLDLDANISLIQGRPPGIMHNIEERNMSVLHPPLDEIDQSSLNLMQIYGWKYKISQMQNRFCNTMNSADSTDDMIDAIHRIDRELAAWSDALPATCRPKKPILAPIHLRMHILVLHLDYFSLVRSIHWAAISLIAGLTDEHLGQNDVSAPDSEALCVDATRSYIRSLNENMDDAKKSNIFILMLQNANCLASIGILYRNIMKNPSQVSARADLEYIRAGKAHLECHIPRIMDRASAAMVEHMLSSSQALVWNSNPCSSGTSCMASL